MINYSTTHVGIIGGSVCGIFTLCKLIDLKIDHDCFMPITITLIEKRAQLGEGMAYNMDYDSNLLNTAAGLLSNINDSSPFCLSNQPSFLKWLRENNDAWNTYYPNIKLDTISTNSYLPRGLIGVYLRKILQYYTKRALNYNVNINIIHGEVIDMDVINNKIFKIILSNQKNISCNKIVLALGGFLRELPEYSQIKNYFSNPWPNSSELKKILGTQSIGIIGSKLSALDTVGILKKYNYQGKIYLLSRTGFLPTVKANHKSYQPKIISHHVISQLTKKFTTNLKLNDLINLITVEIEYATKMSINWKKIFSKKYFSLEWLRWQIQLTKNPNTIWQSVLASLDDIVIIAWRYLDAIDKELFIKSYSKIWETYRFSIPLDTALTINTMIKNKKLTICSNLSEFHENKQSSIFFSAFDRCTNASIKINTEALINASGINYDTLSISSPLIKNIISRKIASPHRYGGFNLIASSFNLPNYNNIFVLGDLTKGVCFFTNSYLVCMQQATQVAKLIFSELINKEFDSSIEHVQLNPEFSPLISANLVNHFI